MSNPRLAQRYAKSLIDLAKELNQLDPVHEDMQTLQAILMNRDFVLMLDSPIIKSDKKNKIISAITNGKISKITETFLQLLCNKNRESNLPGIVTSFLTQYNTLKGLHNAKLTTAYPINDDLKNTFVTKIKASSSIDHLNLETEIDEKIIGGFILEMDGKLIDASILRDLNDVRKQFANNDYIHKLR
ncbi:MAG: ATP synthase F1 subunit delta [Bacteroidota bacterium]|nr:ATP synthase F1 subunit delta [Bacteroidota bacterium]